MNDDSDLDKTIVDFKRAVEDLVSRCKKPEDLEGIIAEAKTLASEWKDPHSAQNLKYRRPLFDATATKTNILLAALVVALSRGHERAKRIRTYFHTKFEALSDASELAELRAIAAFFPEPRL